MSTTLDSLDNIYKQSATNGPWPIMWIGQNTGATTAALTTAGCTTALRYPNPIVMPGSFGAGVTGAYATFIRMAATNGTGNVSMAMCGLEYVLGTLTVSGNSFAAGVSMPTKSVYGSNIVTAAQMALVVATVAVTATTPVLTITYTNQGGTGSHTATLTLPTNPAIYSAFLIAPHLQSGDTAIRSISNMSINTGSAGTLTVYGVLPLSTNSQASQLVQTPDPLTVSEVPYKLEASESIGFYRLSQTAASFLVAVLNLVAAD